MNAKEKEYLDKEIHDKMVERAWFPIKVSPFDNSVINMHPRHFNEFKNLYHEVSQEVLRKYGLKG